MKILPSLFLFFAPGIFAAQVDFSLVRKDESSRWQSIAVDPLTGNIYQRPGFGLEGQDVTEFSSASAFEAATPARTIPLQGGFYGTYAAVSGGFFGHTSTVEGTSSAHFDLASGEKLIEVDGFPNMAGVNGDDTFDWGGLTAANFFTDGTSLYVLGKDTEEERQTWQLDRIDNRFNLLSQWKFNAPRLGFAAMVGGRLLTGDSYTDAVFDHALDLESGEYYPVEFSLGGLGPTAYIDNTLYDPVNDTLYVHNVNTLGFYKLEDAAELLEGTGIEPVPEMQGCGTLLLAAIVAGRRLISPLRSAKS